MKTLILTILFILFSINSFASVSSKTKKTIDDSMDRVAIAYFNKGMDEGVICGMEIVLQINEYSKKGIKTPEDVILDLIENCKEKAENNILYLLRKK